MNSPPKRNLFLTICLGLLAMAFFFFTLQPKTAAQTRPPPAHTGETQEQEKTDRHTLLDQLKEPLPPTTAPIKTEQIDKAGEEIGNRLQAMGKKMSPFLGNWIATELFWGITGQGIVVGLAAQRSISNILVGLQIALTQPPRLDDVVIIEEEWGRIEEITVTYVVVKLWDSRRLIVPTPYFTEKPFQNWIRFSAELLGTVFLYLDYTVPVAALRQELDRILHGSKLWNGEYSPA